MTNEEAVQILEDLVKYSADDGYLRDEEIIAITKVIAALRNQQEWIPCEERLPEDDTLMLVNYYDPREGDMEIWIGWHEMDNVWYIDGSAHSREYGNEVFAWMPLPEAYEP